MWIIMWLKLLNSFDGGGRLYTIVVVMWRDEDL